MPEGQVLEFSGVTKRFGAVTAVDGFTARVEPGRVTGFLGPNGAGKTTTLRMLLGLVRPTSGSATIGGVPYARLKDPLRSVGAVLEASSFHPGRTGANHLKVYAHAAGLPDVRVDETLAMVGLADVGGRKVGGYSLGMRQRLGLAYALLGDPGVLVLDEPANGLDPEGIKWMRGLLRELARQGRTVLVSSHLLTEVQQTVDSLVIISRGRLVFQGGLDELTDPSEYTTVVDASDRGALAAALRAADVPSEVLRSGLVVRGVDPATVGAAAAASGVALTLLQRRGPALEEVFLDLVNGARVHASASGAVAGAEESPDAAPVAIAASPAALDDSADDTTGTGAVADPAEDGAPDEISEDEAAQSLLAEDVVIADDVAIADDASAGEDVVATVDADPADSPLDEAAHAAAPEDSAEVPDAAPAAFVVASTGIIDVVPSSSADDDDTPADAPSGAAFAVGSSGETVSTDSVEVVDEGAEEGASPDVDETADGDRPWEQYVKTEADLEADRFFSTFDREEAARLAAEEAASSHEPETTEGEPWREDQPWREGDPSDPQDHDHDHADRDADHREGGDHR
ncbi:ABC transporter ATP-binding protein [Microbacterium sp. RU33B]|uniref:ABC transporter ATP-binding protein n=1 Tax=Microbacterium sp. RU33B TaxID=1907390 RepID=UPI000966F877|nr:ABC transporter ATP-binding protein [Microbacterium sp. RU33B]SIT86579.1 ABC-type multidrug transport system, ATPase component [Microbacterium sp. RU33B]